MTKMGLRGVGSGGVGGGVIRVEMKGSFGRMWKGGDSVVIFSEISQLERDVWEHSELYLLCEIS